VSQLTNRKRKKQNLRVRDKKGNVLTDSYKVQERRKKYILRICMIRITQKVHKYSCPQGITDCC